MYFRNFLPLEKSGALHLNKLESPSPRDTLCQVWLKLAQWFLRSCHFIFIISQLSPLWEGRGSGEEDENVKSLQTDERTDGRTDRQTTDDR